jgi:Mn2+/Fe2+ NRAMP family transporter
LANDDTNSGQPGVADHLKAAIGHAFDALRCFAAILTGDVERRAHRVVESAAWSLGWIVLGIVGVVFVASGVAELISDAVGSHSPGLVRIVTGAIILAVFVAILLVRRARRERM